MRAQITKAVSVFILGLVLTNSAFAQNTLTEYTKHKYALDNLKMGIKSENAGVRKSAIYFAGKYKVEETAEDLIKQLAKEENPSIRVLIALSLFEIDSEEGLRAVKKLSILDRDLKVKRMAGFVYDEFMKNNLTEKVSVR